MDVNSVLTSFSSCDKIIEKNQVTGRKICFGCGFRGFGPWLLGPLLRACGEADRHGGEAVMEQGCSHHGGHKAEGRQGRPCAFPGHALSDLLPPTSP